MWKVNGKEESRAGKLVVDDETESLVREKKERLNIWKRTEENDKVEPISQSRGMQRGW